MSFITNLGDWLRKISRSFSDVSINGRNIVLTRHNGDTETITTQDTDTTYNTATQSASGLMSATDKLKLDGITAGAEVNQNAFSNIKVGTITVTADVKQDTLTLIEGSNITLSPNATNDSITISATDTTYNNATTSASGLMSASDKTKLNGISTGAEVNQNAFSNIKVGNTTIAADVKTDTVELVAGNNVTLTPNATNDKITIAAIDTTYSNATTSMAGLMSNTDKSKLDNLPSWSLMNNNGRASGPLIYNTYLAMRGIDATDALILAAAQDGSSANGAKFYLYGTGHATNQGEFVLQAGNSTGTYKQLIGNANGSLTWDGVSISLSTHTHSYLPLSGGTITGSIKGGQMSNTYVGATKPGGALLSKTGSNDFSAWLSGYTKNYNVALATFSSNDDLVYLYSVTKTNANNNTNTRAKTLSWNASNGQLNVDSINGFTIEKSVPSNAQFTDTVTSAATSGSGNAVTSITASNGALTIKKEITFVDANNISIASQVSTIPYTFKFKHPSGLLIQAYYSNALKTDSNGRVTWTFAEAFKESPFVFVQKIGASYSYNLYSWSSTRVIIRCNNMSGAVVGNEVTIAVMIFAIGRWK